MSPQKQKSFFHFLRREGFQWGGVAILALMLSLDIGFSAAETPATNAITIGTANWLFEATNRMEQWIWETNTADKQICRLWRSFEIPIGAKVSKAILRITVDNSFTLFLDNQEVGRGSDWRTVTEYDVTWLLKPGRHILAVEAFNDRLEAGLIFNLQIRFKDQRVLEIVSDNSWYVVPNSQRNWINKKTIMPGWHSAIMVGNTHQHPWENWPYGLTIESPLRPVIMHFWQTGWFQLTLFTICLLAVCFSVWLATRLATQSRAQQFLQVERARIARDIHDDLGAQLTQLVLLGEVAQREQPEDSIVRAQFNQICQQARDLSLAMDEVIWAVNSRRDTVRDFVSYVCKYAQIFLSATSIRCRLDVESEIPASAFDLPVRRNLFLAVKEALNNAAKHSQANELYLHIYRKEQKLVVTIEDNGKGFDPTDFKLERNGMTNMIQRMAEIGGACHVVSQPEMGCSIIFTVPLKPEESRLWFKWFRRYPLLPDPKLESQSLNFSAESSDMKEESPQ
jgi:signal transduction histidine kinase